MDKTPGRTHPKTKQDANLHHQHKREKQRAGLKTKDIRTWTIHTPKQTKQQKKCQAGFTIRQRKRKRPPTVSPIVRPGPRKQRQVKKKVENPNPAKETTARQHNKTSKTDHTKSNRSHDKKPGPENKRTPPTQQQTTKIIEYDEKPSQPQTKR